jgi:hypothetical protein
LENSKIELVAVVGDNHVVAAEHTKVRPDILEVRGIDKVRRRVPVGLGRLDGDRHARLDQPMELLDDNPLAHTDGSDLDDLGLGRVVVRRLQINRGKAVEGRASSISISCVL